MKYCPFASVTRTAGVMTEPAVADGRSYAGFNPARRDDVALTARLSAFREELARFEGPAAAWTEANRAAWRRLAAWDKPFLVAFSDRDPITGAMAPVLKDTVPGAAGLEHPVIEGAGHFLQEDAGERLGTVIAEFVRAHPA